MLFFPLVDDQQYMWGPNESQRLETEQNQLAIRAFLLLATAFSAASSSLSASLMAFLMSSITRKVAVSSKPVLNC